MKLQVGVPQEGREVLHRLPGRSEETLDRRRGRRRRRILGGRRPDRCQRGEQERQREAGPLTPDPPGSAIQRRSRHTLAATRPSQQDLAPSPVVGGHPDWWRPSDHNAVSGLRSSRGDPVSSRPHQRRHWGGQCVARGPDRSRGGCRGSRGTRWVAHCHARRVLEASVPVCAARCGRRRQRTVMSIASGPCSLEPGMLRAW